MNFTLRSAAVALSLLLACAVPARADEVAEVNQMFLSGQQQEALSRADKYLAAQPRDARMRFLRGVILTEIRRTDEAIDACQRLTEDFPELSEPYNNLAVIYAQHGEYGRARDALETAVRNNPRYATAQENLGDVYVQLARQAYAHALEGGGPGGSPADDKQLTRKLSLTRELLAQHGAGGTAP